MGLRHAARLATCKAAADLTFVVVNTKRKLDLEVMAALATIQQVDRALRSSQLPLKTYRMTVAGVLAALVGRQDWW